jgi:DNA polymerase I-like protein with 3'-5' exonuclease and polymerase domains
MLGFRRYFTLENKIVKALYDLANNPPEKWTKLRIKTVRRERIQTVSGAVRSALFASAFAQQAANMRAAANHVIQSTGAQITKRTQRKIWDIQPEGINHWRVQPMNIHDEIMCPTHPDFVNQVANTVAETVKSYEEKIPLISMSWNKHLESWADK